MQDTIVIPQVLEPILPDLDMTAGEEIGDEILLASVARAKPAKVKAGQSRSESRAWSFGGNVD